MMEYLIFYEYGCDLLINLYSFERDIMTSLFPMLGVIAGAIMTFLFGLITKERETKLKVIEKFIDKKLEAFEKLNIFINELRSVNKYDITPDNEMRRYPIAFNSKEDLIRLHLNLVTILSNSIWYSDELIKELNFLQDYFVTLQEKVIGIPEEKFKTVGMVIWEDFISLSSGLDNMNKEFFVEEIANLRYKPSKKWHKYKREDTYKKLQSTKLFKAKEELEELKMYPKVLKEDLCFPFKLFFWK